MKCSTIHKEWNCVVNMHFVHFVPLREQTIFGLLKLATPAGSKQHTTCARDSPLVADH
jgi:hypothetical protein